MPVCAFHVNIRSPCWSAGFVYEPCCAHYAQVILIARCFASLPLLAALCLEKVLFSGVAGAHLTYQLPM